MIVVMCILSTKAGLGGYQVKLLLFLSSLETLFNLKFMPFRSRATNYVTIATMVTSALQLLAPILLLNGIIEDQLTGMLMMALNVIAVGIGMVKDATSAVVPIISLSKQGAYACSLGITGTHVTLLGNHFTVIQQL